MLTSGFWAGSHQDSGLAHLILKNNYPNSRLFLRMIYMAKHRKGSQSDESTVTQRAIQGTIVAETLVRAMS